MRLDKQEQQLVDHFWSAAHKNAVLVPLDSVAPGTLVVAHLPDEEFPNPDANTAYQNYWPFITLRVTARYVRVAGVSPDHGRTYATTLPLKTKVAVLK